MQPSVVRDQAFSRLAVAVLGFTVLLGTLWSTTDSDEIIHLRSRVPAAIMNASNIVSYSFFADKRNFINSYFVKQAWGWTTLVAIVYTLAVYLYTPQPVTNDIAGSPTLELKPVTLARSPIVTRALWISLRRYILATISWYYLTQKTWFFGVGPSLSHYILLATGARCLPANPADGVGAGMMGETCKGVVSGGHDTSGHVFLLTHASLFILATIAPTLPYLFPILQQFFAPPISPRTENGVAKLTIKGHPSWSTQVVPAPIKIATYAALSLVALWWGMLFATATFFHHWSEKATGFGFAVAGWLISSL